MSIGTGEKWVNSQEVFLRASPQLDSDKVSLKTKCGYKHKIKADKEFESSVLNFSMERMPACCWKTDRLLRFNRLYWEDNLKAFYLYDQLSALKAALTPKSREAEVTEGRGFYYLHVVALQDPASGTDSLQMAKVLWPCYLIFGTVLHKNIPIHT